MSAKKNVSAVTTEAFSIFDHVEKNVAAQAIDLQPIIQRAVVEAVDLHSCIQRAITASRESNIKCRPSEIFAAHLTGELSTNHPELAKQMNEALYGAPLPTIDPTLAEMPELSTNYTAI